MKETVLTLNAAFAKNRLKSASEFQSPVVPLKRAIMFDAWRPADTDVLHLSLERPLRTTV
jgi:hypothetical protein